MERTYLLAFVYKMEGEIKYRDKLWAELSAAAAFPDWNARGAFLDVAEMSLAFAIGYDWLYNDWTPAQRDTLKTATENFGFDPALASYRRGDGWAIDNNNWNLVCNGGMGLAALAMAEDSPNALNVLNGALRSLRDAPAIDEYAPDGGWVEGPMYWDYGTTYLVTFLAGLESAIGTSFGFTKTFKKPAYARYQTESILPHVTDLLWYISEKDKAFDGVTAKLPLDGYFRKVEYTSFRSKWDDYQANFFGFKAGDNKASHGHLDLGSFVIDAMGIRWAGDMGADDYNMPGYFGPQRFTYYRVRAEGHNTFILNPGKGPDQDDSAEAKITTFKSSPSEGYAIADLTPAYAMHAQKVLRGMALIEDRKWFLLQDEAKATKPAEAWWFMHTKTAIQIESDSLSAILTQNGKRMLVRILSPAQARFMKMDAEPLPTSPNPAGQDDNTDWKKLTIHLSGITDLRLSVVFIPLAAGEVAPTTWPKVYPLETGWPTGSTANLSPKSFDDRPSVQPWKIEQGRVHYRLPAGTSFGADLGLIVSLLL